MILTTDQVLKKIKADGAACVDIWEGLSAKTDEVNKFHRIHVNSPEELIDYLAAFSADFPGKYTIIARPINSKPLTEGMKYNCEFVAPIKTVPTPVVAAPIIQPIQQPVNGQPVDFAAMMAQALSMARQTVANEFQVQFFQNQMESVKEENSRLKEPAYKLAFLFDQVINKIVTNNILKPNPNPMVNGGNNNQPQGNVGKYYTQQPNQQQQQPQQQPGQKQPWVDNANCSPLENTLGYLVYTFGEEGLGKFVNKMKTDASFVNMVNNLISGMQ